MLMSMTGFGRSAITTSLGEIIVEIHSVNRKYLEVLVSIPKEFSRFEHNVRAWIGEAVSRGQIGVRIYLIPKLSKVDAFLPDLEFLRHLKMGWEKIAVSLNYDPKTIDLPFLMTHLPALQRIEVAPDDALQDLEKVFMQALQGMIDMKRKEGEALMRDIDQRLKEMEKMISLVEGLLPNASLKMREKLKEKIQEALGVGQESEDRMFREVALFAEKVDVSEEITRMKSHFSQFHEMLRLKKGTIGRKMDFLVQEMGREINTIGSKSLDAEVSHLVVSLKSELEKIREQIQNIE